MVSLIVEASNGFLSIACLREKNVLAEKNIACSNNLSAIILEQIDACLQDANVTKKDLTQIISSTGPGSYTAIRVVAAVCKTLAYTLGIPLKTISSLKIMTLAQNSFLGLRVPLIDARRGNVFAAVFNYDMTELLPEGYYSLEDINTFLEKRRENIVFIGRDVSKLEEGLLKNDKITFDKEELKASNVVGAWHLLESSDAFNMVPQYLRKTEAERELENDKNK